MPPALYAAALAAALAFNLLLALAGCGAPLLAALCEITAGTAGPQAAFRRKLGQHLGRAGLLCLGYTLAMAAAVLALGWARVGATLSPWLARPELLAPAGGLLALLALAAVVHDQTWKAWKEHRGLHAAVGLLAALAGLAALAAATPLLRAVLTAPPELVAGLTPWSLAPAPTLAFLPLLLLLACAPAAGGAAGIAYMLSRRAKDDWGRDYYAFGLAQASRWTMLFMVLAAAVAAWLAALLHADSDAATQSPLRFLPWAAAGLLALGAALHLAAGRSDAPLRHKATALAGGLCLLLALAALCATALA